VSAFEVIAPCPRSMSRHALGCLLAYHLVHIGVASRIISREPGVNDKLVRIRVGFGQLCSRTASYAGMCVEGRAKCHQTRLLCANCLLLRVFFMSRGQGASPLKVLSHDFNETWAFLGCQCTHCIERCACVPGANLLDHVELGAEIGRGLPRCTDWGRDACGLAAVALQLAGSMRAV